jgi:hypothetical protein
MSEEKRSLGNLTRVSGSLAAVHIDCSHWPRARSGSRSTGKLVRVAQMSPAPNTKQQDAPGPKEAWLELVLTFNADVIPTDVWDQVNRLLQAMTRAAPELKLTYDALHSRAENGNVIIALTPADAATAAERIATLMGALRMAVGKDVQVRSLRLAA